MCLNHLLIPVDVKLCGKGRIIRVLGLRVWFIARLVPNWLGPVPNCLVSLELVYNQRPEPFSSTAYPPRVSSFRKIELLA